MKLIHKVVVGSRLHGLNNEQSDYDYRGVFIHPVRDILDPFKKVKNTSWIEGDVDNTSYELSSFCMMLTQGNPSALEVLWSNMIEDTSDWGEVLIKNRFRFLDSKRIFDAHRGYAHNQYKKMNLFTPDARTPKFAVAYIRSLIQGIDLLNNGTFNPQVSDDWKDYLLNVKYNWSDALIPDLGNKFASLEVKIADAFYKNDHKFTPDIEWISDFVYSAYYNEGLTVPPIRLMDGFAGINFRYGSSLT